MSNGSFLCLASNIVALKVSKINTIDACCDISRHEVYQETKQRIICVSYMQLSKVFFLMALALEEAEEKPTMSGK